ncbi:MAG: RpiB/LacA/LacB family sugar-phosphate isomerase, partial [Candidatus Omnitrophota bacterium]
MSERVANFKQASISGDPAVEYLSNLAKSKGRWVINIFLTGSYTKYPIFDDIDITILIAGSQENKRLLEDIKIDFANGESAQCEVFLIGEDNIRKDELWYARFVYRKAVVIYGEDIFTWAPSEAAQIKSINRIFAEADKLNEPKKTYRRITANLMLYALKGAKRFFKAAKELWLRLVRDSGDTYLNSGAMSYRPSASGASSPAVSRPSILAMRGVGKFVLLIQALTDPETYERQITESFTGGNFPQAFNLRCIQAQGDKLLLGSGEFRLDRFKLADIFSDAVGAPEPAFFLEGLKFGDPFDHRNSSPFVKLPFGFGHCPGSEVFEDNRKISATSGLPQGGIAAALGFQNQGKRFETNGLDLLGVNTVRCDMRDGFVVPAYLVYSQGRTSSLSINRYTRDVSEIFIASSSPAFLINKPNGERGRKVMCYIGNPNWLVDIKAITESLKKISAMEISFILWKSNIFSLLLPQYTFKKDKRGFVISARRHPHLRVGDKVRFTIFCESKVEELTDAFIAALMNKDGKYNQSALQTWLSHLVINCSSPASAKRRVEVLRPAASDKGYASMVNSQWPRDYRLSTIDPFALAQEASSPAALKGESPFGMPAPAPALSIGNSLDIRPGFAVFDIPGKPRKEITVVNCRADYFAVAKDVAARVADTGGREIIYAGSSLIAIGLALALNRYPGTRAAFCSQPEQARLTVQHNDANVLIVNQNSMESGSIIQEWQEARFEGGRHSRRVGKMEWAAGAAFEKLQPAAPNPSKTIVLCCDHGGLALKEAIKEIVNRWGYAVIDCGTSSRESCDYPDFGHPAAQLVSSTKGLRGIFICTTGRGMSMVANRHPGVRAALCDSPEQVKAAVTHLSANALVMGKKYVGEDEVIKMLVEFLFTVPEAPAYSWVRFLKQLAEFDSALSRPEHQSSSPAGKSKPVELIIYLLGGLGRMVPTVSSPTVAGREQVLTGPVEAALNHNLLTALGILFITEIQQWIISHTRTNGVFPAAGALPQLSSAS